jgi:hypothetical protein
MPTKFKYVGETAICIHKEITVKGDEIREISPTIHFLPQCCKVTQS